jgi:hypothetical protein
MLTEEKLEETEASLELSCYKSLTWLAKQEENLTTTAWALTENLCLQLYKI